MPRVRKRWVVVIGMVAVLSAVAVVVVPNWDHVLHGTLTSHCKAFIASQPESRLTYPGGKLILYASGEGTRAFEEVDDPYSLAYIDVPAPQSAVDAWYQSWLQAHGWTLFAGGQYPQETWERVKGNWDNVPSVSLEYSSARGDQGFDATYKPDPSKHDITAVKLIYKVRLYSLGSTLCS